MTRRQGLTGSGFTLLEVILATSLSAVVALAVAQVVSVATQARERGRARATLRAQAGAALRRITADLRACVPPAGVHASGLIGEQVLGSASMEAVEPEDVEALLERFPDAPLEARDRLTVALYPAGIPFSQAPAVGDGAFWQVIYEVDEDPDTEAEGLVRTRDVRRDIPAGFDAPLPETLCAAVIAMELRYYDGLDWVEVWDSSATEILPQAVRVRLVLRLGEALEVVQAEVAPLAGRPYQALSELGAAQ